MTETELVFWAGVLDLISIGSLFSVGGALIYLALKTGVVPLLSRIDWQSTIGKFTFSVATGTITWFLTQGLFGHGVEEASLTGVATAAVIGGVTKFFGEA